MNARGILALAVLTTLAGCSSDDSCVTGSLTTAGLTEVQRAIVNMEAPWTKKARTCKVGGYLVMSPAENSTGDIIVTRNGTTVIIDERNTIYVQSKDHSLVSLQDRDGIGRFDWVSYDAIDPTDGKKYSISDMNADGQPDMKIGEQAGFVNLGEEWSRFEKHGKQIGAVVNGEWQPLEKHGRLFRVKSQ